MSGISLAGVRKSYGPIEVLHDIDLDIPEGKMTVLLGPSGCGKSTLLRMIAGLEPITGGDLSIGGKRVNAIPAKQRGCAMVFQSYALYPHLTVFKNLAFPLTMAGEKGERARQKVHHIADMLQITPLLDRLPRDLSGGQRQRVAMGRAIIREPEVYLFDEPLSNMRSRDPECDRFAVGRVLDRASTDATVPWKALFRYAFNTRRESDAR